MKVKYTLHWNKGKSLKTGKIEVCLANDPAKPPLAPCEAERGGKGANFAAAIATQAGSDITTANAVVEKGQTSRRRLQLVTLSFDSLASLCGKGANFAAAIATLTMR